MSTRAYIAYNNGKEIRSIYLHHDGDYLSAGNILQEYYSDEAKVKALIELGDLSTLDRNIGTKIDFDNHELARKNRQCRAYHRDREEPLSIMTGSIDRQIREYSYVYLYEGNEWYTFKDHAPSGKVPLADVLNELEETKNELMVNVYGDGWFYYKTSCSNAEQAFNEFLRSMRDAGINDDNWKPNVEAILRDPQGTDIDIYMENVGYDR